MLFSPAEMYIPNEIGIMLIGDAMEGKTFLGHTLQQTILRAKDPRAIDYTEVKIGNDDRTKGFDIYSCEIGKFHANIANISLSKLIASCETLLTSQRQKYMDTVKGWVQKVLKAGTVTDTVTCRVACTRLKSIAVLKRCMKNSWNKTVMSLTSPSNT